MEKNTLGKQLDDARQKEFDEIEAVAELHIKLSAPEKPSGILLNIPPEHLQNMQIAVLEACKALGISPLVILATLMADGEEPDFGVILH